MSGLEAFGQGGTPHKFIGDQVSRIVWQGHPMDGLDKAVAEPITAGTDADRKTEFRATLKKYEAKAGAK